MPTNFVLRSPYLSANRSVYRLDAETPLAWFQSIWPRLRSDADVTSKALLDADDLYGFAGFARRVREEGLEAPATPEELQKLLSDKWYSNNVECRDGYVLVETDDDEVELAFWWASDGVFQAEQERFACYAADALPLETGSGGFDPGFDVAAAGDAGGDGAVFGVFATVWDSGNLSDAAGPVKVSGLRLPGLAAWLRTLSADENRSMEIGWLALVAHHNPALDLPALLRRVAEASPHTLSNHWQAFRARHFERGRAAERCRLARAAAAGGGARRFACGRTPHARRLCLARLVPVRRPLGVCSPSAGALTAAIRLADF